MTSPVKVSVVSTLPKDVDMVGLPVSSDDLDLNAPTEILGDLGVPADIDRSWWEGQGFTAKAGSTLELPTSSLRRVMLIGTGDRSRSAWRLAGSALARSARGEANGAIYMAQGSLQPGSSSADPAQAVGALVEGAMLASYSFDRHRSEPAKVKIDSLAVVVPRTNGPAEGPSAAPLERAAARSTAVARAVFLARDLVNEPAQFMTPSRLAEVAAEIAAKSELLTVTIWDEEEIVRQRLGGLLGVSKGSAQPPRLIRMEYIPQVETAQYEALSSGEGGLGSAEGSSKKGEAARGGQKDGPIALVGKGITFDSGGLSLKSAEGMMTMKTDMSGAAAVLAAMSVLGELRCPTRVIGFVPASENLPGGHATKPGDVLTARNGKTIEVLNTDAEGRLVLADALSLAVEENPKAIVDLATLTGACVVALGPGIAGLMGNDDQLIEKVRSAADRAGEPAWPLPLPEEYRSHIDSEVADMKNIGMSGGKAGAISAALLLKEFVGDIPWVHLDIAGPARSEVDEGVVRKGATGTGVRTLIELLEHFADVQP